MKRKATAAGDMLINILEHFSDGVVLLNEQLEVLLTNDAFLDLLGRNSRYVLSHERQIAQAFPLTRSELVEYPALIPVSGKRKSLFSCTYFSTVCDERRYYVVRVSPVFSLRKGRNGETIPHRWSQPIEEPAVTVDPDGFITAANTPFLSLLNWKGTELPERLSDLYGDPVDTGKKTILLSDRDILHDFETYLVSLSGARRRVAETVRTLRDKERRVIGYMSTFRDITRMKQLEERLQASQLNYRRLFEVVNSPIIIFDEQGRVVNMNASSEELYRCAREEMIGSTFDEFFKVGDDRPSFTELLQKVRDEGGKYSEIGIPRKRNDGSLLYTYATYTILESGDNNFAFFITEKDLTSRIYLEKRLEDTLRRVKETQTAAIIGFARITEYRDHTTGNHLRRIMLYTRILARELRKNPAYDTIMNDDYIEGLALSAVLHDIGKVGIEDSILCKPGKLTDPEFERMKQHTLLGGEALKTIDRELSYESFLTIGKEVAWYHHERWDGTGYPEGLKAEDIPLSARIVALADVYDAITSERIYKPAYSHEEALEYINSGSGMHFDPEIVKTFLAVEKLFKRIKEKLSDVVEPVSSTAESFLYPVEVHESI